MDQVLDKATIREVAAEAQAALEAVATKYGMTVQVGGGSYDPEVGEFSPKVKFTLADPDAERRAFAVLAPSVWCETAPDAVVLPTDYGTVIKNGTKSFRLVGLNPRAPKFCFIVEDVATGAKMKLGQSAITKVVAARKGA